MADQLFDNVLATEAYIKYIKTDNEQALVRFLDLCGPMATVLAKEYSRIQTVQDDLIQEANIKLLSIARDKRFDVERGRMYSFLNRTLRNAMVDTIRRQRKEREELGLENCGSLTYETETHVEYLPCLETYFIERFPFYCRHQAAQMAQYIFEKMTVDTKQQSLKSIRRTLMYYFLLPKSEAMFVYNVAVSFLRLAYMNIGQVEVALALAEDESIQRTLLPELGALVGLETVYDVQLVFEGMGMKFRKEDTNVN